jgi:hypothetical protein
MNQIMAPMLSEKTGIPYATLSLFPMVVPTAHHFDGSPVARLAGCPLPRCS